MASGKDHEDEPPESPAGRPPSKDAKAPKERADATDPDDESSAPAKKLSWWQRRKERRSARADAPEAEPEPSSSGHAPEADGPRSEEAKRDRTSAPRRPSWDDDDLGPMTPRASPVDAERTGARTIQEKAAQEEPREAEGRGNAAPADRDEEKDTDQGDDEAADSDDAEAEDEREEAADPSDTGAEERGATRPEADSAVPRHRRLRARSAEFSASRARPGADAPTPPKPRSNASGSVARTPAARRRVASMDELADLSDEELSDLPEPPPSTWRRLPWWAVAGVLLLVLIVALVLWGEVNSQRYYLVCKGSTAEAHQGRGFPWPFGHSALGGPLYRPVPLGVEAQCEPQELDSEDQLQRSLLTLLIGELERRRTVTKLSELTPVRRLLTQGYGLARGDKTWVGKLQVLTAQFDMKEGILRLREVEGVLTEVRRYLVRARTVRQKTKASHIEDPEPWIGLVDHLIERLKAGSAPAKDDKERIPVPAPGTRPEPRPADAGPPRPSRPEPRIPSPPRPEEPPTPAVPILPDAGVRGGGILL